MALISNIHIGLSAWAATHAYSLGNRVSNGGNAYQVITAGTSAGSGGPTGTGSSITDGSVTWKWLSAIDYTSGNAWTGALGTLSQAVEGHFWNDGQVSFTSSASGTFLYFGGHSTTATNTILATTAPGESIYDSTSNPLYYSSTAGFCVTDSTGSYSNIIYVTEGYVTVRGIQLKKTGNGGGNALGTMIRVDAGTTTVIDRCIIDGFGGSVLSSALFDGGLANGVGMSIKNCLIINRATGTTITGQMMNNDGGAAYFVNNTVIAVGSSASATALANTYPSSGTVIANNIFIGHTTNVTRSGGSNATSTKNLTDLTSMGSGVTDTGSLFSKVASNQFVNTSTDFKLKTGADAINAGSTQSGKVPAANDFYGTSRPQGTAWDIGAHELVASAPPSVNSNFLAFT